jgi:hypothetical protein
VASVAIFRAGQPPQYLTSVHTPDYSADPDAIINPDVSALTGVPLRYWKRNGSLVQEMNATEKAAVDTSAATAVISGRRTLAEAVKDDATVDGIRWRALVDILLDEINVLRAAVVPALPARTRAQVKTAFGNRISSGSADT